MLLCHNEGGGTGPVLYRGVPHLVLSRGVPHLVLASRVPSGTPPFRPGKGYPHPDLGWGTPCPDLGWGTPLSRPGMGYPQIQTWDVVTPHLDMGWGIFPWSRPEMGHPPGQEGWDTPSPISWMGYALSRPGTPISWMGYPPPKVEQTHTRENITSRRTTYVGGNK